MSLPPGITDAQLAQLPAAQPPPGHTPNFLHPEVDGTLRPAVIACGAVFTALTIVACSFKIYAKLKIIKSFGWDDAWVIFATACAIVYYGLVAQATTTVIDVHTWDVSVLSLIRALPLLRAIGYFYFIPTLLSSKVALSALCLRLFQPKKHLRVLIWVTIFWSFATCAVGFFGAVGVCAPAGLAYLACSNRIYTVYITAAGMNIASDVSLLLIPLYGIYTLQMHRARKIGICLIFLTGLSAVLSSILGTYYRVRQMDDPDLLWAFAPVNILSTFEVDTTIIVCCLPTMPALLRHHKQSFVSMRSSLESQWRSLTSNQSGSNIESHKMSHSDTLETNRASTTAATTTATTSGTISASDEEKGDRKPERFDEV